MRCAALLPVLLSLTHCAAGASPPPAPRAAAPRPALAPAAPAALTDAPPAAPPAALTDAPLLVAEEPPSWSDDPGRKAKLQAVIPQIEAHLASELARQKLPGLSFGVVIGGELAYSRGFGASDPATGAVPDADTVYRVGSITKTLTATAILRLRDEGKLSLDEPAARYLPELAKVVYPTADSPRITLRHLLTHSSGLPRLGKFHYTDATREVTGAEVRAAVPGTVLEYVPGTKDVYSNFGFSLLGLVVERASGRRYRDYVSQTILAPLGMSSSVWDDSAVPPGRMATGHVKKDGKLKPASHWRFGASEAAGGLYSSVRDMARYASFQLSAYPPRSGEETGPLRRSSIREAHTAARPARLSVEPADDEGRYAVDARASALGLAWHVHESCEDEEVVRHSGAADGYSAWVELHSRAGVGLVLLSSYSETDREALLGKVRAALRQAGVTAPRKERPSPRLESAFQASVALYERFEPARYEELFARSFLDRVSPAAFEEIVQRLRKDHGACKPGAALSSKGPREANFAMACERGRMVAKVALDTETSRINTFRFSAVAPPTEAMKRAAEQVVALAAGARRTPLQQVFSRAADLGAVEQELEDLRERHGRCRLGGSVDSDGEQEHAFRLACERGGNMVMKLELDAGEPGRVRELELEAAPQAGRCPRKP
ncbi:serine hydrolase domain-containing protein [Sorangium sp. So ce136]|uniref:serine hydrolase domain-containing protein n=1 Tax=Sorangium sp. So ce136 TaxID=3133284 RepID=UPI003F0D78A7